MTQIPEEIFWVSEDFHEVASKHEYKEIQAVIEDIPAWGKCTIKLCSDFSSVQELRIQDNKKIKIDGQDQFGISFDTNIIDLQGSESLKFLNVKYIRGEKLTLSGDGASTGFSNCQSAMCNINCDRGRNTSVYLYHSKLYGSYRSPFINVNTIETKIELFHSFIKGGERSPAIYFSVDSDKKLKIKETSLHNGEFGESPIQVGSGVIASAYIYNSVSDANICQNDENGSVINWIVNNNNIIRESNIDY